MKKLVLTAVASLACVAAFAQGKILFTTDSLHLAYYAQDARNGSLAGAAISSANLPAGISLVADLYMGTSSSSLALFSSSTFGAAPGKWNPISVTAPTIPGNTTVFVVAQIRDANSPAPATWNPGAAPFGTYYGVSQEFSFTLGNSITYPPMYNSPNWAPGSFDLSATAGAGAMGAISVVNVVPEPGTFALAGLGAAAMLIFRRRK
jgi:hypothetical protein